MITVIILFLLIMFIQRRVLYWLRFHKSFGCFFHLSGNLLEIFLMHAQMNWENPEEVGAWKYLNASRKTAIVKAPFCTGLIPATLTLLGNFQPISLPYIVNKTWKDMKQRNLLYLHQYLESSVVWIMYNPVRKEHFIC